MPSEQLIDEMRETELRRACAELDRRLRAGDAACAADFFANCPALASDPELGLELVYTEFVTRESLGERPNPADWYAKFPQWRARLERLLEVHALLTDTAVDQPHATTETPGSTVAGRHGVQEHGRRVGAYELLEEIERGGMGVVHRARQVGLNRVVALKMILAGSYAGPTELARFRTEAEAAARLQHPNIVHIYEVNEHDGQPYLSLEFVDGGSLEKKLAGKPLPPHDAAELTESLARAMHYAHQHGVVHRDLKPSNVLLTTRGVPKISDFGLAKQLSLATPASPDAACSGGPTRDGAIIGTPGYMAPEQAGGRNDQIGPPADVYALGAILYELLTGRPPFHAATVLETLEQVRSQDPVPPTRLQPKIARDLETIALKCLEKEPRKRYASAEALADDLGRFRAGEPIRARPIRFSERAMKSARRRPALAALVGVSGTALLILLGAFAWSWTALRSAADRESRRASEAIEQRARAEQSVRLAHEAVDKLAGVAANLANDPKLQSVRQTVLHDVVTLYQEFLRDQGIDPTLRPAVRLESARAYVRLGHLQAELAQFDESEQSHERALALLESLYKEFPRDVTYRHELGFARRNFGTMLNRVRQYVRAEQSYRSAIELEEALLAESPDNQSYSSTLGNALTNMAVSLKAQRRFGEAAEAYGRAIDLQRELLTTAPKNPAYCMELALTLDDFGRMQLDLGQHREAEDACREALKIREEVVARYPGVASHQSYLARSYASLAALLRGTNREKQADEPIKRAIGLLEKLCAQFPRLPDHREALARSHMELANLYASLGHDEDAEKAYRQAIKEQGTLVSEYNSDPDHRHAIARLHHKLANLLRSLRPLEAKAEFRAAIAEERQALKLDPERASFQNNLAWYLVTSLDPRAPDAKEAIGFAEKAAAAEPANANYRNTLAAARYRVGEWKAAAELLRSSIDSGAGTAEDLFFSAMAEWQLGNQDHALQLYRQGVKWTEQQRPADKQLWAIALEAATLLGVEVPALAPPNPSSDRPQPRTYPTTHLASLLQQARYADLVVAAEAVIQSAPRETRAYFYVGVAQYNLGSYGQASLALQRHLEEYPHHIQTILFMAQCNIDLGLHEGLPELVERAFEEAPSQAGDCNMLAHLYANGPANIRNPQRALILARKATELAPNLAYIWRVLAQAHYRCGEWDRAIEAGETGVKARLKANMQPTAHDWFTLAMCYGRKGDTDKATEYYDRALRWWRAAELRPQQVDELTALRAEVDSVLAELPAP